MKKLSVLIISVVFFNPLYSQKSNIGAHIGAGFAIGTSVNFVPQFKVSERPGKAIWIGGIAGFMGGLSKEFHDHASGSQKSLTDLFHTTWGGFLGGVAACEIQKLINKRKAKKQRLVLY